MGLRTPLQHADITTRWLMAATLLLLAAPASANAGTPLMWATMSHLVIGNALIGIGEWVLLAWLLGVRPKPGAGALIVAANYASAWGGLALLQAVGEPAGLTIATIGLWLVVSVVVAFVITLVIEYPFALLAFRAQRRPWRGLVRAVLITHVVSYAALAGWYGLASHASLVTDLTVVPAAALAPADAVPFWYLTPDGRQVLAGDLQGGAPRTVVNGIAADHLAITADDAGTPRIHAYRWHQPPTEGVLVAEGSPGMRMPDHGRRDQRRPFGRTGDPEGWILRSGFWAAEGLAVEHRERGIALHVSLETPFAAWSVRHDTHLGEGLVLFQLGRDQICLLDAPSRRIALVTRGKTPIVMRSPLGGTVLATPAGYR